MAARKHHYVPQCYLKGFVKNRKKPQLFVVDAQEKRSFFSHTENIAAKRDFHRIEIEGIAPDAMETVFSKFEGAVDGALKRIDEARSIEDKNDRAFLFNLMALTMVKNPTFRELRRTFQQETSRILMEAIISSPKLYEAHIRRAKAHGYLKNENHVELERLRQFVSHREYTLVVPTERHLLAELDVFDKILPHFFERKWTLVRAPTGKTGFVTTDRPACLQWKNPQERAELFPPGLASTETELFFSITNTLAAIGTFEGKESIVDANISTIAKINGGIISHARRQIYARADDFVYKIREKDAPKLGKRLLDDIAAHARS